MSGTFIRNQGEADFAAVHELAAAAFKGMPYACGREQYLMDALWRTGAACGDGRHADHAGRQALRLRQARLRQPAFRGAGAVSGGALPFADDAGA